MSRACAAVLALVACSAADDGDADPSATAAMGSSGSGSVDASSGGGESGPMASCEPTPAAFLELGRGGETGYEELGNGVVVLERGPQGGHHTVMGLRLSGADASLPVAGELRGYLEGREEGSMVRVIDFVCREGYGNVIGDLWLIWEPPADQLHERTAMVEASVMIAGGQTFTAQGTVTIFDPEA